MKRLVMMAVALVAVATMTMAQNAAAPAAAATPAPAPDVTKQEKSPVSLAATLDVYSAYVWRGQVLNDRPVWQPGATVSYNTGDYGTFAANAWANFDMTHRVGHTAAAGLNELDYTLSYTKDVGPVSLSVGHIWYTFPKLNGHITDGNGNRQDNYGHSTREIYVTAAYNNDLVTPFVKVYHDYEFAEGFYGNAGLTKTVSVNDRISVGSEISLGAADSQYMRAYTQDAEKDQAFVDFNAALFTSYALTDNVSVGLRVAWMSLVDQDVRKSINNSGGQGNNGDTDTLWGGVNLAVNF